MKKAKKQVQREASRLPEHLNQRLAIYALAAGAAGVGVLALAVPAQAGIIVGTGTPLTIAAVGGRGAINIRGLQRLYFSATISSTLDGGIFGALNIRGQAGGAFLAGPLAKNFKIGASLGASKFSTLLKAAGNTRSVSNSAVNGPWANKNGYLGFEFKSHSKTYFGWAHLSVKANVLNGESGVIESFAWNNTAGQAILAGQKTSPAPEPGALTLSLLALGAVGLFELRRRRVAQRS